MNKIKDFYLKVKYFFFFKEYKVKYFSFIRYFFLRYSFSKKRWIVFYSYLDKNIKYIYPKNFETIEDFEKEVLKKNKKNKKDF